MRTTACLENDRLIIASLKGIKRAKEKAQDDYEDTVPGPAFAWLYDIVRAKFVCSDVDEIVAVIASLQSQVVSDAIINNCSFRIIRLKNRFANPNPCGYRDIIMNIELTVKNAPSSKSFIHICELQIHFNKIVLKGEEFDIHGRYEIFRVYMKGSIPPMLSLLCINDENCKDAIVLYEQAIERYEQHMGMDHPFTYLAVHNLGNLFRYLNREVEAKPQYERALAGRERTLGLNHPDTIKTATSLADLLKDLDELYEAQAILTRVLSACEGKLGLEHPTTLRIVNSLGILLRTQGNIVDSKLMFDRALAGRTKFLGPNHPDTLSTIDSMTQVEDVHKVKRAK